MIFPAYAEYRDHDIEWLPAMPAHWMSASLRWLSRRYSGGTPDRNTPEYWEDGSIPWINSGEVNQSLITEPSTFISESGFANSSAKWIPEGALVMALAGQGKTKGMVAQLAIRATCNQSMAAIVPNGKIQPRFLLWWLQSNYQNIRNMAGGDMRDGLNLDLLGEIACPLPSYGEQAAIATFIDSETVKIDALVEEQRRLVELLKEKRQAVISQAVTKGLDPSVPLKDSGVEWLGEVPAHWQVIKLKHLVVESVAGPYGASLTKDMYTTSGYRVYGQQQVIADDFAAGDYYISEEKYEEMKRYSVFENDVLVSVMGTIGKVAVVPRDAQPGIINPRLVRYRCGGLLGPRFLQCVLLCQKYQDHLLFEAKGTTMDGLNMSTLGNVPVPVPPTAEQEKILEVVGSSIRALTTLAAAAEQAVQLLQERRSALIAAAVTGKIDVRSTVSEVKHAVRQMEPGK